jgi:hypothetical protein
MELKRKLLALLEWVEVVSKEWEDELELWKKTRLC